MLNTRVNRTKNSKYINNSRNFYMHPLEYYMYIIINFEQIFTRTSYQISNHTKHIQVHTVLLFVIYI